MPLHSSTLMLLDLSTMKWRKKYLVITDDCLFINGHHRVGFNSPQKHKLTPNTVLFSTTLKEYSFELVMFSNTIHLAASSELEKSDRRRDDKIED